MLHFHSESALELVNQLRAFENNLRVPTCVVYPATVRESYPDTAEDLLVFGDHQYYQLTVDDRANVDPQLRQAWEETEDALMSFVFDEQLQTCPHNLTLLEQAGFAVYFDFSTPTQPLVYLRLRDGYFYVDISSYLHRQEEPA